MFYKILHGKRPYNYRRKNNIFFIRMQKYFLDYVKICACGRNKISLREKILLLAGEKLFSCGRKFCCLREKILLPAGGKFAACGRKLKIEN